MRQIYHFVGGAADPGTGERSADVYNPATGVPQAKAPLSSAAEIDRAVSVAAAFVEHGIVDVLLVATRPEARRKGYGEALTWRAVSSEPGMPSLLLSSDLGRPVYDRMGFLPLFRFTLWYRTRT